jgi:endonuclease/exonuclease/phosphatase family metal-dependent hydrolase
MKKQLILCGLLAVTSVSRLTAQDVHIHSHNDYRQTAPFYSAYAQQASSIEVDVFSLDKPDTLLVAHDATGLLKPLSFEETYIKPLVDLFTQNKGKAWPNSEKTLTLMVELKTKTEPALSKVIALLNRYPEVFDPAANPHAVRVVITGNTPRPENFGNYPSIVSFDGSHTNYTPTQLERIALISLDFSNYSQWNGNGSLPTDEHRKVVTAIEQVHALNKPVRFWGTPDDTTAWKTFYILGVDYINTDRPEACAAFFRDFHLSLNVMTFNIRYDNPGDKPNDWQARKDAAADMIKAYDIDLLGTQEVLVNQLNDLKERLPQYAAIGVGRADGKESGEYCAILYKKDKFEEEKSGAFWLSETPELAGSKGWDGACERIATWVILKEKRSNKRLFFINTHLDHIGQIARRESVKLLLERTKSLSEGLPVIISGDFNASPQSEPIREILADGKFFDSRLRLPNLPEISGTYHEFGKIPNEKREIIDYLFITDDITVNTYELVPEKWNDTFLSDHTAVYIKLKTKN